MGPKAQTAAALCCVERAKLKKVKILSFDDYSLSAAAANDFDIIAISVDGSVVNLGVFYLPGIHRSIAQGPKGERRVLSKHTLLRFCRS